MPDDEVQKPVGPFEDFDACVSHFESDDEVDDAQALCGWMEENPELSNGYDPDDGGVIEFVESLKEPEAENVLTDLIVTYVSGVGNPAIDSQWLYAKDADAKGADWGVDSPLLLHQNQTVKTAEGERAPPWSDAAKDEDEEPDAEVEQKAWAPVLIPNETDKQGDVIPSSEIEQAAHTFLTDYRKIDTDHDLFEGEGVPIESWTLKEAQTFTLPDGSESREYPAGTWMMGVKFSDGAWERVVNGELTGFSIYGEATQAPAEDFLNGDVSEEQMAEASAEVALAAKGRTGNEQPNDADADTPMTDNPDDDGGDPADGGAEEQFKMSEEEYKALKDSIDEMEQKMEQMLEADGHGDEDEPEKDGGDGAEDGPSLADVHATAKETKETVKSVEERVSDLENEVFEKEDDGDVEEAAEEAAEKTVKSMFNIDGDLPEDPEERGEVIRKHVHETADEAEDTLGSPDAWSDDEVNGVME